MISLPFDPLAAPAAPFARLRAERATAAPFTALGPPPLAGLRHGDILYDADAPGDVYVVREGPGGPACAIPICDEAGDAEVPRSVSALVEDPGGFYRDLPRSAGLARVAVDPRAHARLLGVAAGGRAVHPSRDVWWDSCAGQYFLRSPTCSDILGGSLAAPLSPRTPDSYLDGSEGADADPLIEAARLHLRRLYEVQAHQILLGLSPGDTVFASDGDGLANVAGIAGLRFDVGPAAASPLTTSEAFVEARRRADDPSRVAEVVAAGAQGVAVYRPRAVAERGPFGKVLLWATDGPRPRVLRFFDREFGRPA